MNITTDHLYGDTGIPVIPVYWYSDIPVIPVLQTAIVQICKWAGSRSRFITICGGVLIE